MENIKISECPICGEEHSYNVEVRRSSCMRMLTSNIKLEEEFTRIFTCPATGEKFKGTFKVPTLGSDSQSVEVKGPTEDE